MQIKGMVIKMNQVLSCDMTTGSETKHIIRFALPLLAGNLLQQLYNIVDTIIVGRFLGDEALAAVGATGSITYFFYTLCLGLSIGAGVIISQYFGSKKYKQLKTAIFNSAAVTAVFGFAVSIISVLLTEPVLRLLRTPEHLLPVSAGYMRIACGGTIAVAAYNWINSVMRSLGDSKTPLFFLGFASILNVGLDLLFVVSLNMGVNGAAIATVTAQLSAAILSIIYAFSKNPHIKLSKSEVFIDKNAVLKCIKTGIPIAAQNGMISISMIAIQSVTNTFGETVMAAYTVSMRIEQFVQQPFSSLNAAMSAFVGQNIGAGKQKRAINGLHIGLRISTVFSLAVLILFMIFSQNLVGCFVKTDDVISIGSKAIILTSFFYVFLGSIHVSRGFLNGAGDTNYAFVNGLVEVICRIGLSVILTRIAFIDYWGIWATTCITWFMTALVSILRYKQGKWKSKAVL